MKKVIKEIIYIGIITLIFFKIADAWENLLKDVSHGGFLYGFSYFFDDFFYLKTYSYSRLRIKIGMCLLLLVMFIINFTIFKLLKFSFDKPNLSNRIVLVFLLLVLLLFASFSFYYYYGCFEDFFKNIITMKVLFLQVFVISFIMFNLLKLSINKLYFSNKIVFIFLFLTLLFSIYTSPYMMFLVIMIKL